MKRKNLILILSVVILAVCLPAVALYKQTDKEHNHKDEKRLEDESEMDLISGLELGGSRQVETFTYDGMEYEIVKGSQPSCILVKCENKESCIDIPARVTYEDADYPVTSIGEEAFDWCENLRQVTIPNSVTSIGEKAFNCCKKLKEISIPNSVTSIGIEAFAVCENLEEIHIPESVKTIGVGAFDHCENLNRIIVAKDNGRFKDIDGVLYNKSVTEILACPCRKSQIVIPGTVTTIAASAFSGCDKLKEIVIPNSVKSIGEYAFYECVGLREVTIPQSVTSIGDGIFEWCNNLRVVRVPRSLKVDLLENSCEIPEDVKIIRY